MRSPEDEAELWTRLRQYWDAPRTSRVTSAVHLVGDRPRRRGRGTSKLWKRATLVVLCRNRSHGRPRQIAAVLATSDRSEGRVLTVDADGLNARYPTKPEEAASTDYRLGEDVEVRCRCGVTHVLDGGVLRGHVLGLPAKRTRPQTVDVTTVERRSTQL